MNTTVITGFVSLVGEPDPALDPFGSKQWWKRNFYAFTLPRHLSKEEAMKAANYYALSHHITITLYITINGINCIRNACYYENINGYGREAAA